jgi:hypothetical protein
VPGTLLVADEDVPDARLQQRGRMAPPGSPNITSVPSISRLLMSAWAPVIFI